MIIHDNEPKFIYLHCPKTAGSTITNALSKYNSRPFFSQNKIVYNIKAHKAHYIQHTTLDQLFFLIDRSVIDNYFLFTFVRNPYDKFYSAYVQHKNANKGILFNTEFKEYVKNNISMNSIISSWVYAEFLPCYLFSHYKERCLMDFIGYVENLDYYIRKLEQILHINLNALKLINVRNSNINKCNPSSMDYGDYKYLDKYDQDTIDLVNKIYEKDFDLFGYTMLDSRDFPK